jgi:hypothetical protein
MRIIRSPNKTEWNTSALAASGRAYDLCFEEIAARVIESATVISARFKLYDDASPDEEDGRQIVFVVRVAPQTCDVLYNAPDGMRGRYWQSPDHGFAATKQLIDALLPKLMSFADQYPPAPPKRYPMRTDDIKASLESISAKIWPRERDDDGNLNLVEGEEHVMVRRWKENEERAEINRGMWRRSPASGDLEIKGAIIGIDRTEYIPEEKRDRSFQIHRFGFT